MEVLYASGMRVSELCGLKIQDYNAPAKEMRVLGKGLRERVVLLNDSAHYWLQKYLGEHWVRLAGGREPSPEQPLFVSRQASRLSSRSVHRIVLKYAKTDRHQQTDHAGTLFRGTRSRRTCSRAAPICELCKICSVTRQSARPRSIRTSVSTDCAVYI